MCSLFLFNFINKMCFLISIFVFCFGTEIGTENRGFFTGIGTEYWNFGTVTSLVCMVMVFSVQSNKGSYLLAAC